MEKAIITEEYHRVFPSLLFFFPYLEDSTEPTDEKRLEFPVFSKGSKLK